MMALAKKIQTRKSDKERKRKTQNKKVVKQHHGRWWLVLRSQGRLRDVVVVAGERE